MLEKRPDRNAPCWCGSGKKYKKCHLANDEIMTSYAIRGVEVPELTSLKMDRHVEKIKESAKINMAVLDYVAEHIGAGVTTMQINEWVNEITYGMGGIPADLGYEGYEYSVCTSVNDQVCHGIPSENVVLQDGDIINVDCSTILDGYFSDSSRMFCIGAVSPEKKKLVEVTRECVQLGLEQVRPWGRLGDVGQAVNDHAKANGYAVVEEIGGHGVGFEFHEDPWVGYTTRKGTGMLLVPGLMFTIEPMINMGSAEILMDSSDGWIVRTKDGKPSAQWEIQVLVTQNGYELISW